MDLKVCRICGGMIQLRNILQEDKVLVDKLFVCVNINIQSGDLLPKYICEHCEKNVDICYSLKKQCESTQKHFASAIGRNQNIILPIIDLAKEDSTKVYNEHEKVEDSQCSGDSFQSEKIHSSSVKTDSLLNNTNSNEINSYEQDNITEEGNSDDTKFEGNEKVSGVNNNIVTSDSGSATKVKELTEISITSEYCSINLLSSSGSSCDASNNQEVESRLADLRPLTCVTCNESFSKSEDYRMHIKYHGLERFQCIQCCKYFPSRFRLKRHEEIHNDSQSHQCSFCNKNYRALYNLQRHIRSAHSGKKNFECSVCNVSFSRTDALKRHILLHSDEKKFACSLCSQRFKTKDYLYAHHKSKHVEKSDFTKRNKRIKKDNDNKNQCGYCGKLFNSLFAFKNHLLIHANEKPHKCDTCNKPFRTIAALTIHQRIHDDYRPYQCDLCSKSFRQTSHLKEHRALHLNEAPKHVCSICKASFAKKGNLKAHTRTHAKEKAFKCADCSAEFSFMHLLKRHASRVHCRSVNESYTSNDIDNTCETDDETKNCDIVQNEIYHYIDTVADDNCNEFDENEANFVELVTIGDENLEISSAELPEIFSPEAEQQFVYDNHYPASSCEEILEYEEIHSFDFIGTQSTNENIIEEINYNGNEEQKVDILVAEERKLTDTQLNAYEVE